MTACEHCSMPLPDRKRGRPQRFCSDACRKAASRNQGDDDERIILAEMKQRGIVAKIWPVYRWDNYPATYGLMLPRSLALEELNDGRDIPVSECDLLRVLRLFDVADWAERPRGRTSEAVTQGRVEPNFRTKFEGAL